MATLRIGRYYWQFLRYDLTPRKVKVLMKLDSGPTVPRKYQEVIVRDPLKGETVSRARGDLHQTFAEAKRDVCGRAEHFLGELRSDTRGRLDKIARYEKLIRRWRRRLSKASTEVTFPHRWYMPINWRSPVESVIPVQLRMVLSHGDVAVERQDGSKIRVPEARVFETEKEAVEKLIGDIKLLKSSEQGKINFNEKEIERYEAELRALRKIREPKDPLYRSQRRAHRKGW